jgi:N utilization substance protein A
MQQQSALSLQHVIEQVSQEKGIDAKILVEATEQAILTAAKKTFGPDRELEARFNGETGAVDLFQYMTVVEAVENMEQEISVEDAQEYGLEAEIARRRANRTSNLATSSRSSRAAIALVASPRRPRSR